MAEQPQGWRVVVIANVLPIAEPLIARVGEMGHDVVAWLMQRRPKVIGRPPPPWGETNDKTAPQGVNLIWVRDKADLAPLLRGLEPDVVLCWGFSWKIPQEALDVARYGSVNQHPGLLPRHRGPIPMSWALREGDPVFGITWHRMDAELDTGPILAQTSVPILDEETTMFETGPRMIEVTLELLPRVSSGWLRGIPASRRRPRARPGRGCSETTTRRSTGRARRLGRSTTRCGHGATRLTWGPCQGRSRSSTASV